MAYRFEWDERKARTNRNKHRVTFDEASSVFDDPLAKIFEDDVHSPEEPREIMVGAFNKGSTAACLFHRAAK